VSSPRILAVTNGPGELMGWARPFVQAVYAREPFADVTIVFVPCSYATGREPDVARALFPRATVVDAAAYARFWMKRPVPGMQRGAGVLQYLGGDLYHAATIAKRLGLRALTYKFTKRAYAHAFERFFALDEANAARMREDGAAPDRVRVVGNLVCDAVLTSFDAPPPAGLGSGVCFMPGSRPYELRGLLPFFLQAARDIALARPGTAITFVISPFNTDDELIGALREPHPALTGIPGVLSDDGRWIDADGMRFGVDRSGDYHALAQARLVISIPGTKMLEAAVLGRPALCILPTNHVDDIAMNGVASYLQYVPLVGRPLKRWVARAYERRWKYIAQPNIDADRPIVKELRGVLMPADVVARALGMLSDEAELRRLGAEMRAVYSAYAGASGRMAETALAMATSSTAAAAAM